jgi:hypothetical protein
MGSDRTMRGRLHVASWAGRWPRRVSVLLAVLTTLAAFAPVATASGCTRRSPSRDRDPIPDCWERRNGLVVGRRDHRTDKDKDGLLAIQEYRLDVVRGGVFDPYRANDRNSDDDGGWNKGFYEYPSPDGWEDFDGDGFINTAERAWGTRLSRARSHPSLPATGCVLVPWAVPKNGSANVTLLLQAVLDTVPDGGCLRFRHEGRYRSDGTFTIRGRHDLTIDGNGATLFTEIPGPLPTGAANTHRPHVLIEAGQNITVENLTIIGPNRSGEYRERREAEHGFDVKGVTGLVIRDSTVRKIWGDFVYVDDTSWPPGSGVSVPTMDLLVENNLFNTAGRHGIGASGNSSDVTIQGNVIKGAHRSGIDFEMHPDRTVSHWNVVGNTFRDFGLGWISAGDGPVTDLYVGFNHILGDSMHVKMGSRTQPAFHERLTFEGNVSNYPHRGDSEVFFLHHVSVATFIGNVQPMYDGGGGKVFGLYGNVCGITLIDNQFTDYKVLFDPEEPPPC